MPGSSLWLIPPPNSPFTRQLQTQISSLIPTRFKGHKTTDFIPHVTLTSNIDPSVHGDDGQAWLDGLLLPPLTTAEEASASVTKRTNPLDEKAALERGDQQITSSESAAAAAAPASSSSAAEAVTIEVDLDTLAAGDAFFRKLGLLARKPSPGLQSFAAACRAQGVYGGDFQAGRSWEADEYEPHMSLMYAELPKKDVQKMIPAVMQDLERARATIKPKRDGEVARGGHIVLVPTDRPIDQWRPIASRELPGLVWKWTGT